ncbi:MAG: phosphatidic acid phosphatase, partial [Eudoraea sp.]
MKKTLVILLAIGSLVACNKNEEPIVVTPNDLHMAIDKVTEIMIHDIFSPPVASRIYVYPNIAAYEIIALNDQNYNSLVGQARELTAIPKPDASKPVNYSLAALVAHMDVSSRVIFSEEQLAIFRDSLYTIWESKNAREFNA